MKHKEYVEITADEFIARVRHGRSVDSTAREERDVEDSFVIRWTEDGVEKLKAFLKEMRAEGRAVNMFGAHLENANLEGVDFRGANLEHADMTNAELEGANFRGVNLEGASFITANLKGADFTAARLSKVAISNTSRGVEDARGLRRFTVTVVFYAYDREGKRSGIVQVADVTGYSREDILANIRDTNEAPEEYGLKDLRDKFYFIPHQIIGIEKVPY